MESKIYLTKKHLLLAFKEMYPDASFDSLILRVNMIYLKESMMQLGYRLGVTRSAVHQWITGTRGFSDETKKRIAEAWEFDVAEFDLKYWFV